MAIIGITPSADGIPFKDAGRGRAMMAPATTSSGNPLKNLKGMLAKVSSIATAPRYQRWRKSFMARYEMCLEPEKIGKAKAAERKFAHSLQIFSKHANKLEKIVLNGDLGGIRPVVKARLCLAEFVRLVSIITIESEDLIPSSVYREKQLGYNKFHVGAVLVRNCFVEYSRLKECEEKIMAMHDTLGESDSTDKQVIQKMRNYSAAVQKFCDVLADLGLLEVMLKSQEFEGVGKVTDYLIFIDMKTATLGYMTKEECLEKKLLTAAGTDQNGMPLFKEAAADKDAQGRLIKMIRDSPKLGVGFGNADNKFAEEDVEFAGNEKVASVWGVTLKKTPKNVAGEELIFVDQQTGMLGEISRTLSIECGVITEIANPDGKLTLEEAEGEPAERLFVVDQVRTLLKLFALPKR